MDNALDSAAAAIAAQDATVARLHAAAEELRDVQFVLSDEAAARLHNAQQGLKAAASPRILNHAIRV